MNKIRLRMRRTTIVVLLILAQGLFAVGQKPTVYYYTKLSERYFTDREMDSLLYSTTADVFKENKIPAFLFEKKYPELKNLLIVASKKEIVQSFKWVESTGDQSINAAKGSAKFEANKKLYEEYFIKNINRSFYSNRQLKMYLSFDKSDRITYFHSTVRVGTDGKLLVTERISIYNGNGSPNPIYANDAWLEEAGGMNNEIKRGIVRAFPLYYINKNKLFQNTTFNVKEVLRNGKPENYHTEKQENGVLLYTGSSSVYLEEGYYTYSITYETDHQLKILKDFDELYWNVTGNGWSFRIDSAACTVIFPKGANIISSKCYTGKQGAADEDCSFRNILRSDSTVLFFKTAGPLLPNQGITIASSWQKGLVASPSFFKKTGNTIWDNKGVFFLPIAAIFSLVFCFIYWFRYGRDPEKGTIYPQYEPPAGYSPAALGYIYYQKFERRLTAATIVDAAVRNKIEIEVDRKGLLIKHNAYTIKTSDKKSTAPFTNYDDYDNDIKDLIGTTIEKGKYNKDLGSLNTSLQNDCEKKYKNSDGKKQKKQGGLFSLNTSYTIIPVLVCIIAAVWGFFGGIVIALKQGNPLQLVYFAGGLALCIIVLKIFSRILRAYNQQGRQLMDKIEGFRMFLSTADEKRFDLMNPPERTLALYEKYLPFAIALGCEIAWGEQFEKIIETAYLDGTATTLSSFSQSFTKDSQGFSSSFTSSFSGAISSASTPPSSSSGGGSSFGGGSSGGGGGGGGGGGW